jgi:hypothetical protein
MTTDEALVPAEVVDDRRRNAALLKAIGLDRVPAEQREIALAIAKRYDLDLLMRHLILVEGRPYVTRDGLLWIAHRSGVLDGIEVDEPQLVGKYWHATCRVYRKDMGRPFQYGGRYPVEGKNRAYGPEMAIKVAESMALRRAFNISAPTVDENWDLPTVQADVDAVSVPQQPPRTLAERVQERRASVGPPAAPLPAGPTPDEDDEVTQSMGVRRMEEAAAPTLDDLDDMPECGDEGALGLGTCDELPGHRGPHKSQHGNWPR